MKTTEQIKKEVVRYLKETSKHLFITPKNEFHRIIIHNDNYIVIDGDKVKVHNIDQLISYYKGNSKCIIKNTIFLYPSWTGFGSPNKLKSIKYFKTMKEKSMEIKLSLSDKIDKIDIENTIKKLIGIPIKEEKKSFIKKLFGK